MQTPRLTTKHVMWAILFAAILFGSVVTWQRRNFYLKQATYYEACVAMVEKTLKPLNNKAWISGSIGTSRKPNPFGPPPLAVLHTPPPLMGFDPKVVSHVTVRMSQLNTRKLEYYTKLAEKYRLAASRPWQTVEPDPYLNLAVD